MRSLRPAALILLLSGLPTDGAIAGAIAAMQATVTTRPDTVQQKRDQNITYTLSYPDPLPQGEARLLLRLSRGETPLAQAKLSASATMEDGMKSAVTITPKAEGEYELESTFDMGGEWQLRIQQRAPVESKVLFLLDVAEDTPHHHH